MQQGRLTRQQLSALLREAAQAHAEFERRTGQRDEDWPSWYADFMIQRLDEQPQVTAQDQTGLDDATR